jgi:hypothetical protein
MFDITLAADAGAARDAITILFDLSAKPCNARKDCLFFVPLSSTSGYQKPKPVGENFTLRFQQLRLRKRRFVILSPTCSHTALWIEDSNSDEAPFYELYRMNRAGEEHVLSVAFRKHSQFQ